MITYHDLKAICPKANTSRLARYIAPLNAAMHEFEIDENGAREAAFLAQIAHESGSFNYVREIASGAEYDVGAKAVRLGNTPEDDGDGERYKGRGLIQITGRANYAACGAALGLDLLAHPELLEESVNACRSAGWYWQSRGLNELADKGDFRTITRRINGGLTGFADRLAYYKRAQGVFA